MKIRVVLAIVTALTPVLHLCAGDRELAQQQPQQPPPVFRAGVQVVEVDARVFDREGRFVTTLTRDDFEILEDGVPQQIVAMTFVEGSSATRSAASAATQPVGPDRAGTQTTERQTWIFFFDLNHLTFGGGFNRARDAVGAFIAERLPEGSLAGVIAGDTMVNNRLTTMRPELEAAVNSVKPNTEQRNLMIEVTREWPRFRDHEEALRVARNEPEVIREVVARACSDDPTGCLIADGAVRTKAQRLDALIHNSTIQTLKALNGLASGLARMPGPKTLVFLSGGFTTLGVENTLHTIVGQVARAGARVYAIDVRGLNRGSQADKLTRMAAGPMGGGPQFDGQADGINSLAVDTGGIMIRNENNFARALDMVAADTRTYYVIGYQPTNATFDGKYRQIEIRVKRPGVTVRARQGYLAIDPAKMLIPQTIKPPG